MKCSQCGAAIPDRSKYCPNCGATQWDESALEAEEALPGEAQEGLEQDEASLGWEEDDHSPEADPSGWDEPRAAGGQDAARDESREEVIPPRIGHAERGHSKLVTVFFALGVLAVIAAAVFALIAFLSSGRQGKPDPTSSGPIYTDEVTTQTEPPVSTQYAPGEPEPDVDLAGEYVVTLWVPKDERDQYEQLVRRFNEENNEGIVIYPTLVGVNTEDAADKLLAAPEEGADILCIEAGRLAELVWKDLLSPLPARSAAAVRTRSDDKSLSTAAVSVRLWAYPLSCDGPVLFYDRSVISDSAAGSLDAILLSCAEHDRCFSFDLSASQCISAFFLAPGIDCRAAWMVDGRGAFVALDDNLESEQGVMALRAIRNLLKAERYDGAAFGVNSLASGLAAIASDASKAPRVREILGENFGVAPLPTFGLDGKAYHLGSYLSGELLAVAERAGYEPAIRVVLHRLAAFLTGEAAQLERYEALGICPTDRTAQDAVRGGDPAVDALLTQRAYSVAHGPVPSGWNRAAQQLLQEAAGIAPDEFEAESMMTALRRYADRLRSLVMNEYTLSPYTAMGTLGESFWNKDYPMYEIRPGYYVTELLYLKEGEEFKVRRDGSWNYNYGSDGRDGENCVIGADGWYRVWFDRNTECAGASPRPEPAAEP